MTTETVQPSKAMNIGLWVAQALVGAMFLYSGVMKLTTPIDVLGQSWHWVDDYSPLLVYFTGTVDLLGGIGILLPAITRIKPQLTVSAAIGCAVVQALAFVFHVVRGDPAPAFITNAIVCALAAYVAWGRSKRAPIAPR